MIVNVVTDINTSVLHFRLTYFFQLPLWSQRTGFPITPIGQAAYVHVIQYIIIILSFLSWCFTASILFHSYVQPAKFESGADSYIDRIIAQV